jgi:hypothetical protein
MKSAATLLIAIVALAVSATALGANARVPAKISLKLGPDVGLFTGNVQSSERACAADRKVRIVRISGQDIRVGKGYTDSSGTYAIQTTESSGDWIAKVKHETVGSIECKGAQSKIRSAG